MTASVDKKVDKSLQVKKCDDVVCVYEMVAKSLLEKLR